jgi:hypothetical protein
MKSFAQREKPRGLESSHNKQKSRSFIHLLLVRGLAQFAHSPHKIYTKYEKFQYSILPRLVSDFEDVMPRTLTRPGYGRAACRGGPPEEGIHHSIAIKSCLQKVFRK